MQELNRQMMTLPELRELEEIIRFGTGPAAVSGVSGVHRAMLGAALRQETKRPLAVLCADEQDSPEDFNIDFDLTAAVSAATDSNNHSTDRIPIIE